MTGLVAGGRGRMGALRAGNGGLTSSLKVVRMGGEMTGREPRKFSALARGATAAAFDVSGARA